jgi:5-methylcytosine-specific restriction endonuclease McrA
MSNTEKTGRTGTQGTVCPTPKRDISQEPDMVELKKLLGSLSSDRVDAALEYLEQDPTGQQGIDYDSYLNSPAWADKREQRLRLDHGRCAVCGSRENLQCHHVNYDNFGNEDVEDDLLTLCESCHTDQHDGLKGLDAQ